MRGNSVIGFEKINAAILTLIDVNTTMFLKIMT